MLTINCKDIEFIKHELIVHVSDQVAAIPVIKNNEFVLTSLNDEEIIDESSVINAIKEFLNSIGEGANFFVTSKKDTIHIKSISGTHVEKSPLPSSEFFSCAHCGFVTRYEIEYRNHANLHYL
jgi:hypothetical protein